LSQEDVNGKNDSVFLGCAMKSQMRCMQFADGYSSILLREKKCSWVLITFEITSEIF